MTNIKAEIIAKGKVQKTGYRDHVQDIARTLNVKGFIENMKDGSVKILCETDEATLREFLQSISLETDLAMVEKVEIVKTQPATGKFEHFEIKYGPLEEEMGERLVAAFRIAVATRQDIKSMHQDVRGMDQDLRSVDQNLRSMHQDLRGIDGSLRSMHTDLKTGFESMHEDTKAMHHDLKTSIGSMHQDMKAMHHDLKTAIDSMHGDMNRNFEEMAKRYDVISAELLKTREELRRSVDTLVELVRRFLEK